MPPSALAVVPNVSTPVPLPLSSSLPLSDSSLEDTESSGRDYQQARSTNSWVEFWMWLLLFVYMLVVACFFPDNIFVCFFSYHSCGFSVYCFSQLSDFC